MKEENWIDVNNYLPIIPKRRDNSALISDWVLGKTSNGDIIKVYYHILYGFMCNGYSSEICEECGEIHHFNKYKPIKNIISWQ